MNKTKLNYWVDVGLALSFLLVFLTGIFKFPGFSKFLGTTTSNKLNSQTITLLHDWSGLLMGLLVLIHLILHWKWIVSVTKSMFSKK